MEEACSIPNLCRRELSTELRLECRERARLGRSDISGAPTGFSWALDRFYQCHKKAEAVQKDNERFTYVTLGFILLSLFS